MSTQETVETKVKSLVTWVQKNPDGFRRRIAFAQIAVGFLLSVYGWHIGSEKARLNFGGLRARGTIVDFRQVHWTSQDQSGSVNHSPYMPIVEFWDHRNRSVRFQDSFGTNSASGIGDKVDVLFNRENPTSAMIDRPILKWIPWGPLMFVGLILIASAIRYFVRKL